MTERKSPRAALAALATRDRGPSDGDIGIETDGDADPLAAEWRDHGAVTNEATARSENDRASASLSEGPSDAPGVDPVASSASGRVGDDDHRILRRAVTATTDLEAAARFRDRYDLSALETALRWAEAERSTAAEDGRLALERFRAFAAAADAGDQFHSDHRTPKPRGGVDAGR